MPEDVGVSLFWAEFWTLNEHQVKPGSLKLSTETKLYTTVFIFFKNHN